MGCVYLYCCADGAPHWSFCDIRTDENKNKQKKAVEPSESNLWKQQETRGKLGWRTRNVRVHGNACDCNSRLEKMYTVRKFCTVCGVHDCTRIKNTHTFWKGETSLLMLRVYQVQNNQDTCIYGARMGQTSLLRSYQAVTFSDTDTTKASEMVPISAPRKAALHRRGIRAHHWKGSKRQTHHHASTAHTTHNSRFC